MITVKYEEGKVFLYNEKGKIVAIIHNIKKIEVEPFDIPFSTIKLYNDKKYQGVIWGVMKK